MARFVAIEFAHANSPLPHLQGTAGFSILCNMPRLFGMVIRWTLLPLLFLLAEAMASEFFRAARAQGLGVSSVLHPLALWFAAGVAFRLLFRALMRRLRRDDPLEFVDTLEHELTHALV